MPQRRSDALRTIAIVGGGSIGVGWSVVFATAGHPVLVHEPDSKRRHDVLPDALGRLERLAAGGLLPERPEIVAARIRVTETLLEAVAAADHVQECAPEQLELKRDLFRELHSLAPAAATLATSSSAVTIDSIAEDLAGRSRCLVVHPANPPYLLPAVELVPAAFTAPAVVERTAALLAEAWMSPVVVRRPVEGFVFNRLQGALLREAYCLVRDGVASVDDVDRVVRDGLGRRWAVIGPFETAELNTRGGIEAHAEKLGPAYARMGAERGQDDPWTPDLVARVAGELHDRFSEATWENRVAWRDEALIVLERARRASGLFTAGGAAHHPFADETENELRA
jgi:L-gulonate 3-dehydrogenase